MPIWIIYPVANPDDSRWQGRRVWAEVIVRAENAAFARLIASKLDEPPVGHRLGNESLCFRSGFEDEKLYWVQRLDAADAERREVGSRRSAIISATPWDGAGQAVAVMTSREAEATPRPASAGAGVEDRQAA